MNMLHNKTFLNLGSTESKTLNKAFNNLMTQIINNLTDDELVRVETYDLIISEWVEGGDNYNYEELKYRVTDNENINDVFLSILNRDKSLVSRALTNRLEFYIKEDKYKTFPT